MSESYRLNYVYKLFSKSYNYYADFYYNSDMSNQALLNINQIAARKGAAELEFAVKVNSLDKSKGIPEDTSRRLKEESKI